MLHLLFVYQSLHLIHVLQYSRNLNTDKISNIPLGRYGSPEEFANTVLFLGSGMNTYVTGQMFVADGGMTSLY